MKKKDRKRIEDMTHEESRKELTKMITSDVMRFIEVVVEKRVSLFVDAIYEGVRK